MKNKITIVTSEKLGTEVHTRAYFFACAFKRENYKVDFIKSSSFGSLDILFWSIVRFFKILFSSGDLYLFNPGASLLLIVMIKKLFKVKVFLDIWDVRKYYSKRTFLGNFFVKKADRITYSNKNVPIVISKVYKFDKSKLYHLQTGANGFYLSRNCSLIKGMHKSSEIKRSSLKDSFKKNILYAGDFSRLECIDEVLISFSIFADQAEDVNFVILGTGNYRNTKYIKQSINRLGLKDRVIFASSICVADILSWINKADIIIEYFRKDIQDFLRESIYLREALNLHKPVVCTNNGELINFASYTYQVNKDNLELVNTIVKVIVEGGDGREKKSEDYINENLNYRENIKKFINDVRA